MTIKEMAQAALDVQSASNLSGVVATFHRITEAMRMEHGFDTPTCNRHAVCRLFAEQIVWLACYGTILDNHISLTYSDAFKECQRLAEVETASKWCLCGAEMKGTDVACTACMVDMDVVSDIMDRKDGKL